MSSHYDGPDDTPGICTRCGLYPPYKACVEPKCPHSKQNLAAMAALRIANEDRQTYAAELARLRNRNDHSRLREQAETQRDTATALLKEARDIIKAYQRDDVSDDLLARIAKELGED
jgi:hypothetical protein